MKGMDKRVLLKEEADKAISVPKFITKGGKAKAFYEMDLAKSSDFRIDLCPYDSIDHDPEFLLRIRISEKRRMKISLHAQENEMYCCLFRVDFNGPTHTNPAEENEYVPDVMKPFVGKMIGGNHVHYHVQGFPSGAWAVPVENDPFPVKRFELDDYLNSLRDVVNAVSEFIHLETKIIITGNLIYNEVD